MTVAAVAIDLLNALTAIAARRGGLATLAGQGARRPSDDVLAATKILLIDDAAAEPLSDPWPKVWAAQRLATVFVCAAGVTDLEIELTATLLSHGIAVALVLPASEREASWRRLSDEIRSGARSNASARRVAVELARIACSPTLH